jgi:hypothetical protein
MSKYIPRKGNKSPIKQLWSDFYSNRPTVEELKAQKAENEKIKK